MGTQKNSIPKKSNKIFRKTRSKRQRGGTINNNNKLIQSSKFGNKETVEKLLKEGADVNAKNSEGYTALELASRNGHTEIVSMLLEKGADVNAKTNEGITALIRASEKGHTETVARLLEKGADVNAKDSDGWTALMWASRNGHTETVTILLEEGADVNAKDNYFLGSTALDIAIKKEHPEIVKLLKQYIVAQTLPRHLERQEQRKKDRENLHMVMSAKRIHPDLERFTGYYLGGKRKSKKSKKIFRKTRSKRQRGGGEQEDKLFKAVKDNNLDKAREALDEGANVNAVTNVRYQVGKTALMLASNYAHPEMVEYLLENGADVHAKNRYGVTALHIASREGHTDIVAMLLEKGADVNAKSNNGATALITASEKGHTEIVAMLLDEGSLCECEGYLWQHGSYGGK